jgi:hypothetical protein
MWSMFRKGTAALQVCHLIQDGNKQCSPDPAIPTNSAKLGILPSALTTLETQEEQDFESLISGPPRLLSISRHLIESLQTPKQHTRNSWRIRSHRHKGPGDEFYAWLTPGCKDQNVETFFDILNLTCVIFVTITEACRSVTGRYDPLAI